MEGTRGRESMGIASTPPDPVSIVKAALSADPGSRPIDNLAQALREVQERLSRGRRECPSLDLNDDVLRLAAEPPRP